MGNGNSTEFYRRNPEKYELRKRQIHERVKKIREQKKQHKSTLVCIRCGFSDYRVLDFHHRDPSEKEININDIAKKGWSWERIKQEIDKCDPACRNCHAILHAEEREMPL